jgi:hypothetical protein
MNMEKTCKICKITKSVENFYKTSNGRGLYGVGSVCKECQGEKGKLNREINKDKIKQKRDEVYQNPEGRKKIREYQKKYYHENKDKLLPKLLERQKKYREKINERNRNKYQNDISFKLKHNIKRAILKALKGEVKKDSTIGVLGCTIREFKVYLENNWEEWMNWDNYGKYSKGVENFGWDIDHIIPISSAKTPDDVIKLNHYTNLFPMCSFKNRYIKKDKI